MDTPQSQIPTQSDVPILAEFFNEDGTPMDITGHSIIFTMKNDLSDPDSEAVIQKRLDDSEFEDLEGNPSATDGVAVIWLTAEETDICPGTFVFDIKLIDPDGKGRSSNTDSLTFVQAATRDFS